jgi:hypothetical protein
MKAELIQHEKKQITDNSLIEYKIWQLNSPKLGSRHCYSYRLVYVVDDVRIVGFDNERGKGDHCHLDGQEQPYTFTDIDTLLDDFLREVEKRL